MMYRTRLMWARRRLEEWRKDGERELIGEDINGN